MNASPQALASALYTAYQDVAKRYTAALRMVGEVVAASHRGEAIDEQLGQVLALLAETTSQDVSLAPVRRQWEQAGRPRSDALRTVMESIASLIRQIQNELQVLSQAVQARRDQLADELDACNRRCRMQRAYQGKS
jgi:hypothetical protein